jgi:hypothetical protein
MKPLLLPKLLLKAIDDLKTHATAQLKPTDTSYKGHLLLLLKE